ncbi:MAG: protein translocase SEC61 complex subunit gamma [Candidatus Thermoplasmatota archaeon]
MEDNVEKKSFMEKLWDIQRRIDEKQQQIGKGKYGRILKMARKPTIDEYEKTSKITGLGIIVIGALGFLIYIIKQIVIPWILKALGYNI